MCNLAIDRNGALVDVMLSEHRDMTVARVSPETPNVSGGVLRKQAPSRGA